MAIYQEPVEQLSMYKADADGMWTVDDLEKCLPASLLVGYINPAPAQPALSTKDERDAVRKGDS